MEQHNVDLTNLNPQKNDSDYSSSGINSYNESIGSLIRATEAYQFSDNQIQKYVDGLVNTQTEVVTNKSTDRAIDRPNDYGVGYKVKSNSGYFESTAISTLPYVVRKTDTIQYLFYTFSTPNDSWGIDVGLSYNSGNGVEGWRGCYTPAKQPTVSGPLISDLNSGSKVYFDGTVQSDGYLRFRILDGNDFSTVYYDISYYVGSNGITRTNACINRQISLCNGVKDFNNGAYSTNSKFSDAYIYGNSGYAKTTSSNTIANHCGVFGTDPSNRSKVHVNNSIPWYQEDVSIYFN